ncbi:DUF4397 domain-containing protein [Gramella sp. BOM4]|nr:DUF4397 domain-containing protein [Christiangramia bathymodioli]
MTRIKITCVLLLILIVSGCSNSSEKTSRLRIGQFIFSDKPVEISFQKKDEKKLQKKLNYAELSDYQDLPSGVYKVEVTSENHVILEEELGIGSSGMYTLILNGILKPGHKTNELSSSMRLHEIVEGEEAIYPNAYLPQMRVLNDEFEVGTNEAKIRWVHLAPGVASLSGESKQENKQVFKSSSSYPKASKNITIPPEKQEISWSLKGNKIPVSNIQLKPDSQKLYTIFLIANRKDYLDSLKLVVGETPKKQF